MAKLGWLAGPEKVILLARTSASGFASATINRRLAAISGLFAFQSMRDPDVVGRVPRARPLRTAHAAHEGHH
jgi:hypothetical protein